MFRARFENGVYRDCRFCQGQGCLACPGEADKEYKRQFPEGPKPILSISIEKFGEDGAAELLRSLIGPEAIEANHHEGRERAERLIEEYPQIPGMAGVDPEQAVAALASSYARDIMVEKIIKQGELF